MDASESQLNQYLPVLMLAVLAVLFSAGMLIGSVIVGKVGRRSRNQGHRL
jgi:NADH:ubiquinone oxidoreductase subunit 3 (subunit A)